MPALADRLYIGKPAKQIVYIQLAISPYVVWKNISPFPPGPSYNQPVDIVSGHGSIISPGNAPFQDHGNSAGRMCGCSPCSGNGSILIPGEGTGKLVARGGDIWFDLPASCIASA